MALPILLVFPVALTLLSGILIFVRKKLLHSVIFLALSTVGSSFVFLYLDQPLIALLQILVFVGSLSTYLIVAVASEEKKELKRGVVGFFVATALMLSFLLPFTLGAGEEQVATNSFSSSAETAFLNNYAFLFASVFLVFAATLGSVVIIKRFSRMIV
jgi:NADH:ubiquinone oxidoreductase subunit 6 (subunit J)